MMNSLSNKKYRFFIFSLFLVLTGGTPLFAQVVNNYTVCSGNSVSDNLGTVRCGFWRTIQGSGTFLDSTNHASWTLNNLGLGTNIFWFYEYKNCGNRNAGFTHEHTINTYVYAANAGRDTTICYTVSSYQLNGNDPTPLAGVTGTWTVASGSGTFANNHQYNECDNDNYQIAKEFFLFHGFNRIVRIQVCRIKIFVVKNLTHKYIHIWYNFSPNRE